jgi:hypothetical protein
MMSDTATVKSFGEMLHEDISEKATKVWDSLGKPVQIGLKVVGAIVALPVLAIALPIKVGKDFNCSIKDIRNEAPRAMLKEA